jgi:hypothetical protein
VPFLLLMIGGAVSLYCLWQLRRWLAQSEAAGSAGARQLENLVDELVATAETTVAMVDEKAEVLSRLLARADERLGRLSAVPGVAQPQALPAAEPVPAPAPEPAPRAVAEPVPHAPHGAPAGLPDRQREMYATVYALADAGHDVTAIARRLNMTKGEIQLILGLRQAI